MVGSRRIRQAEQHRQMMCLPGICMVVKVEVAGPVLLYVPRLCKGKGRCTSPVHFKSSPNKPLIFYRFCMGILVQHLGIPQIDVAIYINAHIMLIGKQLHTVCIVAQQRQ